MRRLLFVAAAVGLAWGCEGVPTGPAEPAASVRGVESTPAATRGGVVPVMDERGTALQRNGPMGMNNGS